METTEIKSNRQILRLRNGMKNSPVNFCEPYAILTNGNKVVDGVIRKCASYETFDPVAHFSQYDANDFALENIIAAGAFDMLKDAGSVSFNNMENADLVDAAVSGMEDVINNNVNNAD